MKILVAGDLVVSEEKNITISPKLLDLIRCHDYKICNFEGVVLFEKSKPILKAGPHVWNSKEAVDFLYENGFNVAALANNHIMDFGVESLKNTISLLELNKILYTGAGINSDDIYTPLILNKGDEKVCLINCGQAEFGVCKNEVSKVGYAWVNSPKIKDIIIAHKNNGEKVVLFAHCGMEDQIIPLPEWKQIYHDLAELMTEGDCIIATHPHIVQGYEIYNKIPIYYSLGNFLFYKECYKENVEWNRSLIISIDTELNQFVVIPVSIRGNILDIDNSESFSNVISQRSKIIADDTELNRIADSIAEKTWQEYYKSYYCGLEIGVKDIDKMPFLGIMKYLIKRLLGMNKVEKSFNETMLLHNIQIESHRFCVERYLYRQNIKANKF